MLSNERGISQLLQYQVQKLPEQLAIVSETQSISYAQFWCYVCYLAKKLKPSRSFCPLVIYGDKSIESISAMISCLLIGQPYIPLQAPQPIERLRYIFNNSQVSLCLYHLKDPSLLLQSEFDIQCEMIQTFSSIEEEDFLSKIEIDLLETIDIDMHAFTLYTSGSTGLPKGVLFSQKNLLNFILWAKSTFQLNSTDRVASFAPLHSGKVNYLALHEHLFEY
jgi:long-subunit acyl-CoA synthetase (AMP-forming)